MRTDSFDYKKLKKNLFCNFESDHRGESFANNF